MRVLLGSTKWSPSFQVELGMQAHLRRTNERGETGSTETMPRGAVLMMGLGLQRRASNLRHVGWRNLWMASERDAPRLFAAACKGVLSGAVITSDAPRRHVTTKGRGEPSPPRKGMHPVIQTLIALLVSIQVGACLTLDSDPPDYYVEATTPDIYFTGPLTPGLEQIFVQLATAPLRDPILLPAPDFTINVVTYSRFGDNYYDGSLGLAELTNPVQGDTRWLWTGEAALPTSVIPGAPGAARFIGIQIRGLPYEAMRSVPAHEYCVIEALGLGVGDCSEWIDAILQLIVLCRGLVGQVVDCHGLNWVIVPRIIVGGIGSRDPWPVGVAMAERKPFKFVMLPGVIFELDSEGWRYAETRSRTPRRGEEPAPLSYRGPFQDTAEAARDFAAALGGQYAGMAFSSLMQPDSPMRDDDMQALLDALDAHMPRL